LEKKRLYFLYDPIIRYSDGHKAGGARAIKVLHDKITFIAFDDYINATQFKNKINFEGIIIEAEKYGTIEYPPLFLSESINILLFTKESLEIYDKKDFGRLKEYVTEYKNVYS